MESREEIRFIFKGQHATRLLTFFYPKGKSSTCGTSIALGRVDCTELSNKIYCSWFRSTNSLLGYIHLWLNIFDRVNCSWFRSTYFDLDLLILIWIYWFWFRSTDFDLDLLILIWIWFWFGSTDFDSDLLVLN